MKKYLILFVFITLLSCSKDDADISSFSLPTFLSGTWQNPADTNLTFIFTSNNIIEDGCCIEDNTYIIDYNAEFANAEFEITEIVEEAYYRVQIKSKANNVIDLAGAQTEFYRAFRKGIVNGKEAILLEYQGTAGGYMYRVK